MIVLGCSVVCVSAVQAQQQDLNFKHITSDHGLAHNNVYAIFQDARGFMWFGTQSGLNRYDGYEMRLYRSEVGNPSSIDSDWITYINEDSDGTMWVCTSDGGGLNKYNYETDSFESVLDPDDPQLADLITVYNFAEDRNGFLWLGTNIGLIKYDKETRAIKHYTSAVEDAGSLSDDFIRYVFVDSNGILWVGTRRGGLNKYDERTDSFKHYQADPSDTYSLSHNLVMQISEDASGTLWVSTLSGLNRFDPQLDGFHKYLHEPGKQGSLSNSDVRTQFADSRGKLWVGTYNGGLNLFDASNDDFEAYVNHPAIGESLSNNKVRALWEDHTGILWIGTENGVNYVDLEAGSFQLIKHDPTRVSSISDNAIYAIHADARQHRILWVGTEVGGVNRVDMNSGVVSRYTHDAKNPNSLSNNFVEAIYIDQAGTLWAGTRDGLNKLDEATGTFTHYLKGRRPDLANRVRVIYEAPSQRGVLWLAAGGAGLVQFDTATGDMQRYEHIPGDPYALSYGWVSSIFEDSQGRLWVGTSGGGLCRFFRDKGTFKQFRFNAEQPNSLASLHIEGIGETGDGMLWLATENGLVKFDPENEQFFHYTERNSDIATSTIRGLVVDANNQVWMSTIAGVSKYTPATDEFEQYDIELGLQGRAFNARVAHIDKAGTIYFGGLNGLNYFLPRTIKGNPYPPRTVLTGLRLFDEVLEPAVNTPLERHISSTASVELKHYQNELSIEFVGLHFSRPDKNQYQVMLASYDDDWRAPTMERKITYTSLNPGNYTFMVRSANAYGVWSEDIQQFDINIASPWWLRYWAFGIYMALFTVGVVLVDRYQRARLLKKEREAAQMREAELRAEAAELKFQAAESDARALKAENEQKEVELQKAEELKEAYDALQDSMKQLKVAQNQLIQAEKMASLGQLTAGIAHEIKNPLNFVVNFARISQNLMEDLKELLAEEEDQLSEASREEVEHMLTTLSLNTERISEHGLRADSIVKSMMEHSRTSSGAQATVSMERVLNQAIDLAHMGATEQLEGVNLTIERNYDAELGEIKLNAQDFKRVIINILDNAFYVLKETASQRDERYVPTVCISGRRTAKELEIRIKDNGPGLDDAVKAKIFDPFFTTKPPGTGNTGLGLSLSFDIITQGHNGVLTVAGNPGEGAEFIIRIPT